MPGGSSTQTAVLASMRPPRSTGENATTRISSTEKSCCFNEAPAKHGGKQPRLPIRAAKMSCFNEAPAKHGGKRAGMQIRRKMP